MGCHVLLGLLLNIQESQPPLHSTRSYHTASSPPEVFRRGGIPLQATQQSSRLPAISLRPKQEEDASCCGWGWQPKSFRAIPFHAKSELISSLEVKGHCSPGRHLNKSSESLALQILLEQDVRLCSALTRYQQSEGKLSSLLNPIIAQEAIRSRLTGLTDK